MHLLIYISLFTMGLVLNALAAQTIRKKAELLLSKPYTPLPDIIHTYIPKIPLKFLDYFLFLCVCSTLLQKDTLSEIEENVLCCGICLIIRSFTVFFTIMPTCMPKPKPENGSYVSNVYHAFFLSTHDLMFSGHSLFFIAIGNVTRCLFIKCMGPFLLVVSRQHYTIDVCVSGLVYYTVLTLL